LGGKATPVSAALRACAMAAKKGSTAAAAAAEAKASATLTFAEDEEVLSFHGPAIYNAKVQRRCAQIVLHELAGAGGGQR
jgi:hypothetical protein